MFTYIEFADMLLDMGEWYINEAEAVKACAYVLRRLIQGARITGIEK